MTEALDRALSAYGIRARGIWAAEHAYTIYNRRFHEIRIISVYAAVVNGDELFFWMPHDDFTGLGKPPIESSEITEPSG